MVHGHDLTGSGVTAALSDAVSIRAPNILQIRTGKSISYGANQIWYPALFARMAGCGPTAASNLLWYLCSSRPDMCGRLFDGNACERSEMLRLMRAVWPYVKPGLKGVNKAVLLADGATRYAAERSVMLKARILEVPSDAASRPFPHEAMRFLTTAFSDDLPVALMNLGNKSVKNLESWHWVTMVSIDSSLRAEIYDQSRSMLIDFGRWLTGAATEGALVAIEPL